MPVPAEDSEYQHIMPNPYQRPSEKFNQQKKTTAFGIHDNIPGDDWYNNDYHSAGRAASAAQEYSRMKQINNEFDDLQEDGDMGYHHGPDTDNKVRENPFATFFRYLLLGFLIGLVILLIIWFVVLS